MPSPPPTRAGRITASSWVRTSEPLIWLGGAGREVRGEDYFFDTRKRPDRPHVVLQLTLDGAGFYENHRGIHTPLHRGMAFLDTIPGRFRYGYEPTIDDRKYELVYVSMVGAPAQRWRHRIARSFGNTLSFGEDNAVAPQMLALARQHADGSLGDRYLVSAQLYQLLMTVLSALTQSRAQTTPLTGRALAVIAERGHRPDFRVDDVAAMLDCSREHLSRQFRAATGVSPSDYLIQHRLRLAAREIRTTQDKLELIARRTGFSGANYLCRAFRQRFGITPAQYRVRPQLIIA